MNKQNSYINSHKKVLQSISKEFGLAITQDKRFENIQVGPNYWVSFYLVSDRILFTFPYGDSSIIDMEKYYQERNNFLSLYQPEDKKIVEIRNYSDVNGFPDKKSRLIQAENLIKENDRLLAFLILQAPVYVRIVFRVGMKINKGNFPVYFLNNYRSALKKAQDVIRIKTTVQITAEMLKPMKEYDLSMANFEINFSIIPNILIYIKGKGAPDVSQTKIYCETEKAIYNKYFTKSYPIYRIVDYSEIKKTKIKPILTYAKQLKSLYNKGKLIKNTIAVGASPFIRNAITMVRKLFSTNTIFVGELNEAFNKINLIESLIEKNENLLVNENIENNEQYSRKYLDKKVDDLIGFISNLTWNKPEISNITIDSDDFLKPIYEALSVIKNDVNNLLLEREKYEEKLKLANKKLELDLKAREKYEEDRQLLEEQLHQSEKMHAIGQLAGGIAHDFNNQLAAVVGYADLLRRNLKGESKLIKYADNILLVTGRAKDLTSQLLAFARKGKYNSTNVNMHDLIHEVSNLSEHTMDKKIKIRQELNATSAQVKGDQTQLQNVLLNLSINARDAMPDGGTITFKTENINNETDWFKNRGIILGPGNYLKISICDTGTGIPDGIRNHIFEPFFTTKKTGQGTGMGLGAVYGTIKNHNGSIEIDTVPGKGTTFYLILPLREPSYEEDIDNRNTNKELSTKSYKDTIFIIDDEETVLETTTELMQEMGYTVFSSQNPLEAVELYKEAYSQIDLVLLDMIMPEMGGAETYKKLKEINKDIKVIITSGYSIEHEQRLINENEGVYFIQKPYDIENLCTMANKIIHS